MTFNAWQWLASLDRRLAWLIGALLLLAIALTQPMLAWKRDVFNAVFVIDITQSMNTKDYQVGGQPVSRLQISKDSLRKALLQMPCGSKVGMGIFNEYRSFLLLAPIEVCSNYTELMGTLSHISGKMAWAGGSEIAKGLNWGLKMAKSLEPRPSLVFLTDGHEAPPIRMNQRPHIDMAPGEVQGLLVGLGGAELSPIPKIDPEGNSLGFWRADEVAQTDIYSQGRGGSVAGEKMSDDNKADASGTQRSQTEHLSSLKGIYLQLLAQETGLSYARLSQSNELTMLLTSSGLGQRRDVPTALAWLPASLALCALLVCYLWRFR